MNKFLDYVKDIKTALIISSRPLDLDCLGSGLIMKKYLESLGKKVSLMFPAKISRVDKDFFNFLPYFDEVKDEDTREILKKKHYDLLVLVDGMNLVQFFDANQSYDNPPDINIYDKRIHIDHHASHPENLGTLTYYDPQASSTTEIVLRDIVPMDFIDSKLATLGYGGIVGDTGNFMWSFSPETLKIASELLKKGADQITILDKLFFNKSLPYLKMLSFAINQTEFDPKLGIALLCLSYETLQKNKIDEAQASELKRAFDNEISKMIPEYPIGISLIEKEKGVVSFSGRGNTLRNKISLPTLFAKLGGNSGGHFNAAGAKVKGDIKVLKNKLLAELENLQN